ncbi:hypothetical protein LJC14_05605 [Treponema sp. OttesenSCG-928-L16]|nr:hypothetical protein [Treponema sp. OttesenSCG-928-L16]
MQYSPKITRSFVPRYYEMDAKGEVTPTTMMALFEETAANHCVESGWDMFALREEGLGWILIEGNFEMMRYPVNGECFSISTWLEGARYFYGLRRFEVRGSGGEVIGRARSLWAFYSIETKRPVPIKKEILEAWKPDPEKNPVRENPGGHPPQITKSALPYRVRSVDIDTNGHVNNVRYLEWAIESVNENIRDSYFLSYIEGRFIHEVVLGQRIKSVSEYSDNKTAAIDCGLGIYAIDPLHGEQRAAACARSIWKARKSTTPP